MSKFRKKPVVIDAWLIEDVLWQFRNGTLQEELVQPHRDGVLLFADGCLHVQTLEGDSLRGPTDAYLIKGVKGEFYPCAGDIFRATYDVVDT